MFLKYVDDTRTLLLNTNDSHKKLLYAFIKGYMSLQSMPCYSPQFQELILSTVHTFNLSHTQPFKFLSPCLSNHLLYRLLANSTAANSPYIIRSKFIQIFQDVPKQLK